MAAGRQCQMSQLRQFLLGVSGQVYIPNLVMALYSIHLEGRGKQMSLNGTSASWIACKMVGGN